VTTDPGHCWDVAPHYRSCKWNAADWRARALAAEAERSEILAIVNPSSDQSVADRVRELIEDLCESQADAARWRKVAPLIDELSNSRGLHRVHEIADQIAAAAQEPTP
jgi:hypothetical protein